MRTQSFLKLLSVACISFMAFVTFSTEVIAAKTLDRHISNKAAGTSVDVQTLELRVLAKTLEQRISTLKVISRSLANDTHIHAWVNNGMPEKGEQILLDKLEYFVNEYDLTSASFADKTSNKYWNHEGFLRVLDPSIDTWYFNYTETDEPNLISIYHDKNKRRVDLYVNFQQVSGSGLSGVATSFESALALLRSSDLTKHGQLYIVDKMADVKVHPDIVFQKSDVKLSQPSLSQPIIAALVKALPQLKTTGRISVENTRNKYLLAAPVKDTGWYIVFEALD